MGFHHQSAVAEMAPPLLVKSKVEGEVMGSRPTWCSCVISIKMNIAEFHQEEFDGNEVHRLQKKKNI